MANIILLFVLAVMTLLAMAWAHYRLNVYRLGTRLLIRTVLLTVGVVLGIVVAFVYTSASGMERLLIFFNSLGVVHVPAAVILQLKHLRRSSRSQTQK